MKKLLALLMAALMLTGAAFAEEDDWYLDTAEELAACVGELAGDEAYLNAMGYPVELVGMAHDYVYVDFTVLLAAWRIEWSETDDLLQALFAVETGELSDAGRDYLVQNTARWPLLRTNSEEGTAEWFATSQMLTYSRTYIMPEDFQTCTYLLLFNGKMNAEMIGVAFSQTGEETITATALPVLPTVGEWLRLQPLDSFLFSCEQVMSAPESVWRSVLGE